MLPPPLPAQLSVDYWLFPSTGINVQQYHQYTYLGLPDTRQQMHFVLEQLVYKFWHSQYVNFGIICTKTLWPSGPRRCIQAAVLVGTDSNPAEVSFLPFYIFIPKAVPIPKAIGMHWRDKPDINFTQHHLHIYSCRWMLLLQRGDGTRSLQLQPWRWRALALLSVGHIKS